MLVEIFEARASEETDSYIIRTKAENPGAVIRKISIFNAEAMKKHPDVVAALREKGADALPIVKIDGLIASFNGR
ncbi:MAG: hypothetical protein J4431_01930 [Candidatus Aenigmarchaeota archaeon]|nr:hypothetical protein [Candidatus Aenigmarchaeota archaeon]